MSKLTIPCFFTLLVLLTLANCQRPQRNVVSGGRQHAGFVWLWLKADADHKQCARPFTDFQKIVLKVTRNMSNSEKSIVAGVGFGSKMYSELCKNQPPFEFVAKQGKTGGFPASGGDIFIHAKSNSQSKLFELTLKIISMLPADCLEKSKDLYSFKFKGCRDLSGFIDGTNNPKNPERKTVAVDAKTGGSFAITQQWVHKLNEIAKMETAEKEAFIGRKIKNSKELQNKISCSHVAKMKGGTEFNKVPKFKIYRQSESYGTVHGPAGLFFIAFAKSTDNFESMLNAMVGKDGSGEDDCIFNMSQCISGNYWYFPGQNELTELKNKCYM